MRRWLRYIGWALGLILVLLVGGLTATWYVAHNSKSIGELYVERSMPDLTAAACVKNGACEFAQSAPIAAPAEYRRCGGTVAGSRIKGEPLACSEQLITDLLLSDWSSQGQSAYRQLRRGCRKHDLCYRHGNATFGLRQEQCDREFLAESLRECWLIYGNENDWLKDRDVLRWACQARASAAYIGVSARGDKYFEKSAASVCEYEGGPHAARDQVVAGRFLGGTRDYVMSLSLTPDQQGLTVRLMSFGADGQSQDIAVIDKLSPQAVPVGDRDWACQRRRTREGGFSADCPETLGQSMLQRPADWLRFAPVVVDSDGDGADELIIPSLVPDFGLVFTHIRVRRDGERAVIDPPRAYLGVSRMAPSEPSQGGCEDALEFADCGKTPGKTAEILSKEAATQNSGFQFTVVASADVVCDPPGQANKQDVLLLSAYSDFPGDRWDTGYVLRRFLFDAQAQRWDMRRDKFNNDYHRMAGCTVKAPRDQFQTHSRMQYPAFAVRVPPPKTAGTAPAQSCAPDERLAVISRDKCTTSTPVAKAGSLNDIDIMLYRISAKYKLASDEQKHKDFAKDDAFDEVKIADVRWLPLLWAETADPILTSRFAREQGIAAVATFIGGTDKVGWPPADPIREGHNPVIAVLKADHLGTLKEGWQDRYADTVGHVPELYGVLKSSSFRAQGSRSEAISNLWDPHRYGSARMYFQIPAVLAPFSLGLVTTADPTLTAIKGASMVFFANSALWAETPDSAPTHRSERLPIEPGKFRLMIVPIASEGSLAQAQAAMLDCPADAATAGAAVPAAQRQGFANFLRREPVLAGKFLDEADPGSLAVAWREAPSGNVRLTALRYESKDRTWRFGNKECARPVKMNPRELYRDKLN
jgi:hypothetical protein